MKGRAVTGSRDDQLAALLAAEDVDQLASCLSACFRRAAQKADEQGKKKKAAFHRRMAGVVFTVAREIG